MILAIDVGVKTLALCCIRREPESKFNIVFWELCNVLEDTVHTCTGVTKKGLVCGKKCSYRSGDIHTCKVHANADAKPVKQKKLKEYSLHAIAKAVIACMDTVYTKHAETLRAVEKIVIELQPRCNNKMKMVSHIIFGKLVDITKDTNVAINFVRASQKLKAYDGPPLECSLKGEYAKRKWLSVRYAEHFLKSKCTDSARWTEYLAQQHKKDDIADTLNMCMVELKPKSRPKTTAKASKKPVSSFGFTVDT